MKNFHFLMAQTETADPLVVPDSLQKVQWAQTIQNIQTLDWNEMLNNFATEAMWIALKIVVALVIYFIGRALVRWVLRLVEGLFERKQVDVSLREFLKNMISVVFYLLLALAVVQTLGINITSIIAIFSAATLAIGMALSGTMQNFAGGVMILLLRPYRVGDYIEAQGQGGTVEEIMLFSTKIVTPDRQTIYVPNSAISNSIIDNFSHSDLRRVDISVSISYGDDVELARKELLALAAADERVMKDPETVVLLASLDDSAVKLSLRMWVKNANYWGVLFDMNERIYKTLPQKGLHFPYPHLVVNVRKEN